MPDCVATCVARYLGLSVPDVIALATAAPVSYKRYSIPKSSGGRRIIHQPTAKTKALQHALMETILPALPVHPVAAAYVRGNQSPLLKNALQHAKSAAQDVVYRYSVRIDFRDFFPSIVPDDLIVCLRAVKALSDEDESFLRNSLFVQYRRKVFGLAVGAPSSPMISNAVMFSLDRELYAWASARGGVYTRYADDLVYSSNVIGDCAEFVARLEVLLKRTKSPCLTMNRRKTVYSSLATRRRITGLIVTPDGKVSVGRRNKRYLRKLLHKLRHGRISKERRAFLRGYLAFVRDVEPDLVNSLAIKFTAALLREAVSNRPREEARE
jgi:RNA-directed DNA polymerase